MRRGYRLFTVLVVAFVIVACGLIVLRSYDDQITVLEDTVKEKEVALRQVQSEQSELEAEIRSKDTNGYIIDKARSLGYLMPGEIRFVVANPEVLYDVPTAEIVDIYTEEEIP